jgi:hypothetical protein
MKKGKLALKAFGALVLLWLLTGGLVIARYDWILPEPSPTDYRPLILLDFPHNFHTYGIPFICTYTTETAPLSLTVSYITHSTVLAPELQVDKVVVEYGDGTIVDLTGRVAGELQLMADEHWYIDDDHVDLKKPSLRATCTIPNCLPKRGAFVLRITTRLISQGQVVESYESATQYKYYSESSVMITWWHLLVSA